MRVQWRSCETGSQKWLFINTARSFYSRNNSVGKFRTTRFWIVPGVRSIDRTATTQVNLKRTRVYMHIQLIISIPSPNFRYVKTNSHKPAVPFRANSHMTCCAPAVLRQCRVLRESPRVAGKIRTANRGTPRGGRKKPNVGRSPTGRGETVDVNSHIPCRAPAPFYHGLEKSLAKRHDRSTAWYVWIEHGCPVLFK